MILGLKILYAGKLDFHVSRLGRGGESQKLASSYQYTD
jgi:hypothetical protein